MDMILLNLMLRSIPGQNVEFGNQLKKTSNQMHAVMVYEGPQSYYDIMDLDPEQVLLHFKRPPLLVVVMF